MVIIVVVGSVGGSVSLVNFEAELPLYTKSVLSLILNFFFFIAFF